MRHFLFLIDGTNLTQILYAGTKTTMHVENLAVDDGQKTELVEVLGPIALHYDRHLA